jgi:hypothetical protein
MNINPIKADIIYKALYYVCHHEKIEVPKELKEVFEVLAFDNPNDTNDIDVLYVMNGLNEYIRSSEPYVDYFNLDGE